MAGERRNSGFVLCSKCPGLFQNSIVAGEWQNSGFVSCKGGLMSESGGEFSNPPKWVPKTYLEAQPGFLRLLLKGNFDPYVLVTFDKS